MTRLIDIQDVSLQYPDGTTALSHASLWVESGENVAIVGPSGCGKSTLLRLASGLIEPTSGSVERTKNIQYVFQDSTLLPWRNVRKNVALNLELQKCEPAEIDRRVDTALSLVGLMDSSRKLPRQLSGGMKMRVSLARSLACEPQVFLFDEPFAALDEFSRERLNLELRSILQSNKSGSLFVTHSIAEAVILSNRVLIMSQQPGTIVKSVHIPFSQERTHELRYSAEFAHICGDIASTLRELAQL